MADLNPTRGAEMRKRRPVVVVSSDSLRSLPLRLVAPLTGWNSRFEDKFSHVQVKPSKSNGLSKESAADVLGVRGIALERFDKKLGRLSAAQMEEIAAAIAMMVEYT